MGAPWADVDRMRCGTVLRTLPSVKVILSVELDYERSNMLEPLVALAIAAGPHGPVDSVSQEDISAASSTSNVDYGSMSGSEQVSIAKYTPASGILIDADQLRWLYLPYN